MTQQLQGRVAIDITRQYRRVLNEKIATGIDKVDLSYMAQYQEHAVAVLRLKNRWYILNNLDSSTLFKKIIKEQSLTRKEILSFCAKSYLVPKYKRPQLLINTSHSGLENPAYATQAKSFFSKIAYFLHDIIPLEYPEYCKVGEDIKHAQRVRTIIESGHLVITNSRDTLVKLNSFTQKNFGSLSTVGQQVVAFLGTSPIVTNAAPPINPTLSMPYFVILGTIEPRKNHLLLLSIWRRLAEILKEDCPKLYIVGKRGWDVEQVIDIIERAPYARQHIVEISDACDEQVVSFLKNARALLFPSFAEGFGLPLIQALQVSTPVIASNLAVFKELAGDIPDYVDPIDVMKWLEIIINYTNINSTMHAAQLQRLAEFQAFSWEEHFNIVTAQLNHLLVS